MEFKMTKNEFNDFVGGILVFGMILGIFYLY